MNRDKVPLSMISKLTVSFLLYLLVQTSSVGGLNSSQSNAHIQTFQGQINQNENFQINITTQHVLVYNLDASKMEIDIMTTNIRIETNVQKRLLTSDELECPVIFSSRQKRTSKSWALPLQINSKGTESGDFTNALLYTAGHTVCLDSNGTHNQPMVKESQTFLVFVSTCSPYNVTYSVVFSYSNQGFLIDLDKSMHTTVSPSISQFYRFDFSGDSDHVIVQVTSEDKVCMTAAIQSPWCQFINSNSDSKRKIQDKTFEFQRTWQDMTSRAVIPVTKEEYPNGFFVAFAVHDSDKECESYNGVQSSNDWLPFQRSGYEYNDTLFKESDTKRNNREKNLNITVTCEISTDNYAKPIFFPIYFLALVIALTVLIYVTCSFVSKSTGKRIVTCLANSDEEDLILPDNLDDESVAAYTDHRHRSLSGHAPGIEGLSHPSTSNARKKKSRKPNKSNVFSVQVENHSQDRGYLNSGIDVQSTSGDYTAATTVSLETGPKRESNRCNDHDADSDSDNNASFSPVPPELIVNTGTDMYLDQDNQPAVLRQHERSFPTQNVNEEEICVENTAWLPMNAFIHKTKKLKKSLNKIHYLIFTIGIFYILPTIQLLYTYHQIALSTGENDLCYRNYLCSHQMFGWDDFNHIYSNVVYIITGIVFMVFVSHYQSKVQTLEKARSLASSDNLESSGRLNLLLNPRKGNGVIHEFGVFYALGLALSLEGILSGSYHVCPTQMNFQFDTSFMYILAVLSAIKIYQFRHADPICPHNTFGLLAVIAFISVGGLVLGSKIYEGIFFAFHGFFVIMTSIYMYYLGHVRDSDGNAVTDYSIFKQCRIKEKMLSRPLSFFLPQRKHLVRLIFIIPFIALNVSIDVWQIIIQKDFPMYLLYIFAGNMMFYFIYYFFMKAIHGEFFNIQSIQPLIYLLFSVILGSLGMMYFMDKRYDASVSPAESRVLNQPCLIGQFYDTHDVWHILSAGSIFFFFMTLLTLDDGILLKPRSQIIAF